MVGNTYHELLFGAPQDAAPKSIVSLRRTAPKAEAESARTAVETGAQIIPVPVSEAAPPVSRMFARSDADDEDSDPPADAPHPREHRYGDGQARITDFYVRDAGGRRVSRLTSVEPYEFVIHVEAVEDVRDICMGVLIRTSRGTELYGADSMRSGGVVPLLGGGEAVVYVAPFRNNLAPGDYFATASLARIDGLKHDLRFDALEFSVEQAPGVYASSLTNLEMTFDVGEVLEPSTKITRAGAV